MADEAVESIAELKPVQYTAKYFFLFLEKILHKKQQLNEGTINLGNLIIKSSNEKYKNVNRNFFSTLQSLFLTVGKDTILLN